LGLLNGFLLPVNLMLSPHTDTHTDSQGGIKVTVVLCLFT